MSYAGQWSRGYVRRSMVFGLVSVVAACVLVPVVAARVVSMSPPGHLRASVQDRPADSWRSVLTRLSRLRAQAWRRGRPQLLKRVYVVSAPALRSDRSMLERYLGRGLTVRGARLAFGRVRVASRAHRVVRLRVVDQLQAAVAVGRDGGRVSLPRDRPTRHLIALARTRRGWRIESVTSR